MKHFIGYIKHFVFFILFFMLTVSVGALTSVEEAHVDLANLKRNLHFFSAQEQIQKFQQIAQKMDQYNQAANQIFAPYLCQYLLPDNSLLSDTSKRLSDIPAGYSPLLFGLILKYDAKIALMRNDRMQLDNLVKAIEDVWINLRYGYENVTLCKKISEYLNQTDYETACVMDFNIPDRINPQEASDRRRGASKSDVVVQQNKLKWNKLLDTAKLVNSSNFAGWINVYKNNVDKGIRQRSLYEEMRNNLSELMPKDKQSINDNMIKYMADYFYNYINKLQEYFEKEFVVSVVDCGSSDPKTFNTCGINSLLISDTQEGNFKNLRQEVCLLLKCLSERDNNLKNAINTGVQDCNTKDLDEFTESSEAFQSTQPLPPGDKFLDNFTSQSLLECAAYATNYNCIVLLDSLLNDLMEELSVNDLWSHIKITLNQLQKAVSILSPLFPIKLIRHTGGFHYQSFFLKDPIVPDNLPNWIKGAGGIITRTNGVSIKVSGIKGLLSK